MAAQRFGTDQVQGGMPGDGSGDPTGDQQVAPITTVPVMHLGTGALVGWAVAPTGPDTSTDALLDRSLDLLCRLTDGRSVDGPFVSVELPATDVGTGTLVPVVRTVLARHAVPARRLRVEIVEAGLVPDVARGAAELAELRALGVRIGIGAGTPQSSLASLRDLPADHVRLHRSVTESVGRSTLDTSIARAVVMIARELQLEVVADGIDDQEAERAVRRLGCALGQGAHVARRMRVPGQSRALPPHRAYPMPAHEAARLSLLHDAGILDSAPEEAFDELVQQAAELCDVPLAIIALVDAERQWHKASHGLAISESIEREHSICAHAICAPALMEVEDLHADPRFDWNPYVHGDPGFQFYAGAPLLSSDGTAFGAVCVLDHQPRRLDERQRRGLELIAASASARIELRARLHQLAGAREAHERAVTSLATATASVAVPATPPATSPAAAASVTPRPSLLPAG